MKVGDLADKLSLEVLTHREGLQKDISGGYVSDMLSDVMANSKNGNIWITLQTHPNIVAVANLKNLSGIVIVSKRQPEEETLKKATSENITILRTDLSSYEIAGKIYHLLQEKHR
jgi:serine kinase of HPr protein (carbohydrate metabolism regulator)